VDGTALYGRGCVWYRLDTDPLIPLCPLAPGGFFQRESEWHVAIAPEPTNLRRPRQCASPAWSGFSQVHQAA